LEGILLPLGLNASVCQQSNSSNHDKPFLYIGQETENATEGPPHQALRVRRRLYQKYSQEIIAAGQVVRDLLLLRDGRCAVVAVTAAEQNKPVTFLAHACDIEMFENG